jgi:hypothetical protein
VLDLFAGKGEMFGRVWSEAARYRGNDRDIGKVLAHPATCHHAPAITVIGSLDLAGWNVIDLDAYGSPWKEVTALASRRSLLPGERLALVLTNGSPRSAMLGNTPHALSALAGAKRDTAGAHRRWNELARTALVEAARRMGGTLANLRAPAGNLSGRDMWYALAILENR